jgi:hypothetical protein
VSTRDERDDGTLETARFQPADGDDIVVLPDSDPPRSSRRNLVIGIVVVMVIAGVIAVLIANAANQNNTPAVRTSTPSASVVSTPAVVSSPKIIGKAKSTVPVHAPAPTGAVTVPTVPLTAKPATLGTAPAVTAPQTVPTATVAPPKQYGVSALTWSGPRSMTILAGKTVVLAVAAHNHTDGTVTLPHPLSCTPRLDHGEICAAVVQILPHGTSAGAQYTIDARGVAPGHYTLTIEGVLTVAVTVRTNP